MSRCEDCGGIICSPGCPAYEEPLPEADEDERGGEYDEPTTLDCWKNLDAVWEARERRVR